MRADPGTSQAVASAPRKRLPGCCLYWRSPFFVAIEQGDAAEVARFLHEDSTWLRQTDKRDKRTAWHVAAASGHVEVLRALVQRTREEDVGLTWSSQPTLSSRIRASAAPPGPDERVCELVNGRASWGIAPLVLAAERDQVDAVKYLLSVGADPWQGDNEGRNPAHYAARAGAVRALQVLLEEERPLTSRASTRNHPGSRYVDSLDSFGFTPLHYATWANRKSAMMLLIGFDANIVIRSVMAHTDYYNLPAGATPLHIACLLGDLDRVKLLLRAYYETAADLLPSQTALLGSVERRRRARSHPDPRLILTRTQRLPFHIAARAGHRQLLDWLDPSVPLMFLFGGEEDGGAGPGREGGGGGMVALVGVSRLTVIAAKALHQALLDSLDAAAEDIRRHEEAVAEKRRRREERRLAREAEAAAQSLKAGKELPPEGFRGRIRRLMERASKDGGASGVGAAAAATAASAAGTAAADRSAGAANGGGGGGGEEPKTGWRPWRSRVARRGRRRGTASGVADGDSTAAAAPAATAAGADGGGQHPGARPRSPRRRRRRSATGMAGRGAAGNGGAGATAVRVSRAPAATGPSGVPDDVSSSSSGDDGGESSGGEQVPKQAEAPHPAPAQPQPSQLPQPPRTSGNGALNGSLRLRIFRSSNSQVTQPQQPQPQQPPRQRPSNIGRDLSALAATEDGAEAVGPDGGSAAPSPTGISAAASAAAAAAAAAGNGSGGGNGALGASLTRTGLLQRLVRGSLRRQSSGSPALDPAAAQLNERLNRVGITIPEGPDQEAAYFTPGRGPRYNMPTQILLPASAFNTSLRTSEIGPNNTTLPGGPTRSTSGAAPHADTSAGGGAVTAEQGASASTVEALGRPGAGADARDDVGARRGDGSDIRLGSSGRVAEGEGDCAGPAGAEAEEQAGGCMGLAPGSGQTDGAEAATAATAAAATDSVTGEGVGAVGSRTASQSTSILLAELLSRRSGSCRRSVDADGARSCGAVVDAEAAAAAGGGSAVGLAAAGPAEAPRVPEQQPDPGQSSTSGPYAPAAGFTSVEQLSGQMDEQEEDVRAAATAGPPAASGPTAAEPPRPPARPRPGSAAAPLRPRLPPPPLGAPCVEVEEQLLPPSASQLGLGAALETVVEVDGSPIQGREEGNLGPPGPLEAAVDVTATIRSADASRVASRRQSLQLPGTAATGGDSGLGSGLPSPSGLLPPPALAPVWRGSGDDVGAASNGAASAAQVLEGGPSLLGDGLSVLERRLEPTSADGVVRAAAAAGVVDGAAATASADAGWGLSSGMGRVGAGALQLLSSLRNTLRRTSGQHQAQVVPVVRSPRSPSPTRRYHHHHYRRSRTPDSSVRRGLSPGRSPGAAGSPGSPSRAAAGVSVGVTAGVDGTDRGAVIEVANSPNPSYHRGSAYLHPHPHLAARGVRVASGRPHARLSLFGRGSGAEAASGGGAAGAAAARRRGPLTPPQSLAPSAAQTAEAERDRSAGSEPRAATPATGPAAEGAAAGDVGADGESLRSGDAAAASFSSASSVGPDGAGTGGAAAAGDDDEDVCPVCLDEAPNLLVQTCRHQICVDCARDLVRRHSLTPALCPYCRGIISSFKARVAAGPAPRRWG